MSFLAGQTQAAAPPPPPPMPPPPTDDQAARAAAAAPPRVTVTPAMSERHSPSTIFGGEDNGINPLKLRKSEDTLDKLNKAKDLSDIQFTGR